MSWFDPSGLASIAKNALKEAQKQIDKALDIQDEADEDSLKMGKQRSNNQKSKTAPSTPIDHNQQVSLTKSAESTEVWGSFTGSFFENPNAKEMITTPPKGGSQLNSVAIVETMLAKRESLHSNSDSVDILSSPTSPSTNTASFSENINNSESVELITNPTCSDVWSPDSSGSLPESIVVIGSEEDRDDDDDSMSYSTVMGDSTTKTNELIVPHLGELHTSTESKHGSLKFRHAAIDDALFESQTVNSDSTQSFEEVQMIEAASVISDDKDLVKINSGPSSSGHNSNDELETTTSSDIEIISNPNGDSSSTNSVARTTPIKQIKCTSSSSKKGHFREPSEVSTISEDSLSDSDKLLHRISELNEIIEARELQLLEIGRQNASLQEKNFEYQNQLDTMKRKTEHLESEEYTQRLSSLERKFQMSIRERDSLRVQLKSAKDELLTKIPKNNLTEIVAEKEEIIAALQSEGEKLSKDILQQSNIIKKLRAKEKTSETLLKRNKDQIVDLTDEVDRLKKTLSAKEDVERSQIEAVYKMSSDKRKLEEENCSYRSTIEDMNSRLITLQTSLDAAKVELHNREQAHLDLTKNAQDLLIIQKENEKAQIENNEIRTQLNELREKLRISEAGMAVREQKLRQENASLLKRLEESETRAENLMQEVSVTTIPLMRQLESLQTTLTTRSNNWNKLEKDLLTKLEVSKNRLISLENVESSFKEKIDILQARIVVLEEKLSTSLMQEEQAKIALHQAGLDSKVVEYNLNREINALNEKYENLRSSHDNLREKYVDLEEKYKITKACARDEQLPESVITRQSTVSESNNSDEGHTTIRQGNASPAVSLVDEALGSFDWQVDDLDCLSSSGRQMNSVHGMPLSLPFSHNASTLEHLQSIAKQREGEVNQLQWELSRLQVERDVLSAEISSLSIELENIKEKLQAHEELEKNFVDLQRQYDALLQMYGEKVEQTQELELDLQDVKDMYKAQIDELLRQRNQGLPT